MNSVNFATVVNEKHRRTVSDRVHVELSHVVLQDEDEVLSLRHERNGMAPRVDGATLASAPKPGKRRLRTFDSMEFRRECQELCSFVKRKSKGRGAAREKNRKKESVRCSADVRTLRIAAEF